jgi:hypothetical protein
MNNHTIHIAKHKETTKDGKSSAPIFGQDSHTDLNFIQQQLCYSITSHALDSKERKRDQEKSSFNF